jgi:hypothetical protein
MKQQTMWVMWYLMLSGLPLTVAALAVKELIMGHGEPVQRRNTQ